MPTAMKTAFAIEAGSTTAPLGFRAAAFRAGIKESRTRDDLALLVSDVSAAAAGVFTTNRVQAAPVRYCRRLLVRQTHVRAVLINAGNANACTGPQGDRDAAKMARAASRSLRLPHNEVLVCSTGTIGIPLPMPRIEAAMPALVARLSRDGTAAANAILTTDKVAKTGAVRLTADGKDIVIGGMAKGSGMIAPNMATMLAFITTDAAARPAALRRALRRATQLSFNRITVDGDESTNDTVLLLANGMAGNRPLDERHPDWPRFQAALNALTLDLAKKIVRDGEGATKFVTVRVCGAASPVDAQRAARAVAQSLLVKTSWFGGDPNWGRLMAALGYSGARIAEERIEIRFDGQAAVRRGRALGAATAEELAAVLRRPEFVVEIRLGLGSAACELYTCDCSEEYVRINAEYMT